ncbi:MAG TPA: hypothetical protein VG826_14655 [Pirellulales bacterium]|nr:hypothetical protein [Pirellulales bacterium]
MTRLVQQLKAFLLRLVKRPRDRVLAKLRSQIALAVSDDLREIARHLTAERVTLSAELNERLAAEMAPLRRQLEDVNLCNDGMLHEVVRLQRELQQLLEAVERLSAELSAPATLPGGSFGDAPRSNLVDGRQVRAA